MAAEYILAIDLGTSGPKVALVSTQGEVVASEVESTELFLSDGGGAEQDPDDWWRAITTATRRITDRYLVPTEQILAVAVTSQWAGTVPVDAQGNALGRAIIWLDSRGAKYVPEVTGGWVRIQGYGARKLESWLRKTGGVPSLAGKEPVAHILFLRHERPEVYAGAYKFMEPKDYLNLRLTGEFVATVDSIALHWVTNNRDIDDVRYDDQLLTQSTLPRDKLPNLVRAVDVVGHLTDKAAIELGLDAGTKVVGGTPDVPAAAVGSGAVRDFEGHIYIGTSSWLTCHVPFKKTDLANNMASLPSALPGRYFIGNEQETAGACMTWLRDNVFCRDDALDPGAPPDDVFERFGKLAAEAPAGSDKVLFTPWLYGEHTPVANPHLRAAFANVSLRTTRAHLIRAVMEGVAYNTRWLMRGVESFNGQPFESLRFIGGGAKSELWCQILADVLNRPIDQVADPLSANVRGAAFVAAVGLGRLRVDDIPALVPIERRYSPNPAHRAIYEELFSAFLTFQKNNEAMYNRLNASAPRAAPADEGKAP
ncbi:MAG: FGGY-family carbohydrate kinase [Myxococcota bacterium]